MTLVKLNRLLASTNAAAESLRGIDMDAYENLVAAAT